MSTIHTPLVKLAERVAIMALPETPDIHYGGLRPTQEYTGNIKAHLKIVASNLKRPLDPELKKQKENLLKVLAYVGA